MLDPEWEAAEVLLSECLSTPPEAAFRSVTEIYSSGSSTNRKHFFIEQWLPYHGEALLLTFSSMPFSFSLPDLVILKRQPCRFKSLDNDTKKGSFLVSGILETSQTSVMLWHLSRGKRGIIGNHFIASIPLCEKYWHAESQRSDVFLPASSAAVWQNIPIVTNIYDESNTPL